MESNTIRFVEELSLNAWPALRTNVVDGWLLRIGQGYTRRANSVQPLYAGNLPQDEKVAYCEQVYGDLGQPVIFKMTPASKPSDLDAYLTARGYRREAETSVQLADVTDLISALPTVRPDIRMEHGATSAWCAGFAALNDVAAHHLPAMQRMLAEVTPPAAFASVMSGGLVIATGMAVAERECVGLFDLAVEPAHRRHGLASALVAALCSWASTEQSAQTAYLQVVSDNDPALALYSCLGFVEAYRYWYRVKG